MTDDFRFERLNASDDGLVDVIFVHGLGGDARDTWSTPKPAESDGAFWPAWLDADVPGLNISLLSYPAPWFIEWAKKQMNLYERAKQVLEVMAGYGVGRRPLVFVCHSLGGLVVKQLLRTALESTDDGWKRIAAGCRGIFFVATPHKGSALANTLKVFSVGLASPYIEALTTNNEELTQLNESCRAACGRLSIPVYCYYEMYSTVPVGIVVDKESADPGIGTQMTVPISANHIEISRPAGRHSTLYLGVSRRLAELVDITSEELGFASPSALPLRSPIDRRDLHEKLLSAGREHEYDRANEAQNRFARHYVKTGLIAESRRKNDALLADIEDRFNVLVFDAHVRKGADNATIDKAVLSEIVAPLEAKYQSEHINVRSVRDGIYFLTEKCHIRWDRE